MAKGITNDMIMLNEDARLATFKVGLHVCPCVFVSLVNVNQT